MAVPATSTYNPNRARIVQMALTNVGAIGPGTVNPTQDAAPLIAFANDKLNTLVKSMDTDGVLQWRDNPRTFTTVTGAAPVAYTLPNDVYDLDQPARYLISGQTNGIPLYPMTRDEWYAIGDQTMTSATPIRYYAQKNIGADGIQVITLYLWPNAQNAGDTVQYSGQIRARDQNTDADTMDVNQKWLRCLEYGLSADLAPGFGLPMDRVKFFQDTFEAERERCLMDDNERADIQLVPFGSSYYGPYGRGDFR